MNTHLSSDENLAADVKAARVTLLDTDPSLVAPWLTHTVSKAGVSLSKPCRTHAIARCTICS